MVTDYAAKDRGPGWGLRVLKMGMSRKLLFLSGLLWAIDSRLDREPNGDEPAGLYRELYTRLRNTQQLTPLERALAYFQRFPDNRADSDPLLLYDRFHMNIHDLSLRKKLERRGYDAIRHDKDFLEAWAQVRLFHTAVLSIFFDQDEWMNGFLRNVFF